ncbi:MAG: helix-turn-helix transcriptional regulator [Patescibacteria group bacterium]
MKIINGLKFFTTEETFAKSMKSPDFRKEYEDEVARLKLVRQIKDLRLAQHMSQKKMASKANMSQSIIARIESGRHSFSVLTLYRIAKVFGKEVKLA